MGDRFDRFLWILNGPNRVPLASQKIPSPQESQELNAEKAEKENCHARTTKFLFHTVQEVAGRRPCPRRKLPRRRRRRGNEFRLDRSQRSPGRVFGYTRSTRPRRYDSCG